MKYIRKAGAPSDFTRWSKSVRGTNKADYREIPRTEKQVLLTALIDEQGALCAYTMRRIDSNTTHIEHIKPESRCRADEPGSDLKYANLVACFPREGMSRNYRYGAQKKDNWWQDDGEHFISPLHPQCEKHFHFRLDGTVAPARNDVGANTTIEVLGLDHSSLVDDRKRAIEEFIYGTDGKALSKSKVAYMRANICARKKDGAFYEFCIAISQALDEYGKNLDKKTRRRRFARKLR